MTDELNRIAETRRPLVISYGGGVNSTAVLVGYAERWIIPDAIVFADTGGEKPETYATVALVSAWCVSHGMPEITIVRRAPTAKADYLTLEEECTQRGQLPSRAYGFSKCAHKWKVSPQIAWMNAWQPAIDAWAQDRSVYKAIGFHMDEQRRVKGDLDKGVKMVYPLIEWRWDQRACRDAITRSGLPQPVKSACFFCPSSSRREVANMARNTPDLFARAVAIEHAADAKMREVMAADPAFVRTVIGLGREYTWESVGAAAVAQCLLNFDDASEDLPCGCHDGGGDDDD